jgi:filamentous hemagglutinin family protein
MSRHGSMNRAYRLIWSHVRSTWVPVAETARGRGKSTRAKSVSTGAVVGGVLSLLALAPLARASPPAAVPCVASACSVSASSHPLGGQVVSGKGHITQSGDTTTIQQSSQNLFLDWLSFDVGSDETVNFVQPSSNAVAVNEIFSTNGSQILGHLNANGEVWLINPNGIIFGQSAEVNVGGLVASTLNNVSQSGNTVSFSGDGVGSVVNAGTINAATGGSVALLGNHVGNQGTITAKLGTVALGAGSAVTLTFSGNSLVRMQVDQSTLKTLAENGGMIQADGGTVILSAGAKDALLASVVNNTGVIEAHTVENHDGTIELLGGMTTGTVNVGGTLDASAPEGGDGGLIETNAAHVAVANDAKVTTTASKGLFGTWLIDPTDLTVAASGGDITGAALSHELDETSVTLQSSNGHTPVTDGGPGGNINVNDTVSWSANTTLTLIAAKSVNVNSNITASGASAALVISPFTANGSEPQIGNANFNLGAHTSITLSGADAALSIGEPIYMYNVGAGATINLPNVSPISTTALIIGGTPYTVINSLGAAGSITGTDLQGINGNLSGNFALGSNITAAATATWNSGAGFTPIGNANTPFIGTFDGLGHTISGLAINLPTTDDVGLFGNATAGPNSGPLPSQMLRDVGIIGGSVSGADNVGELAGSTINLDGMISNSYATGSVSGSSNVGGLVGNAGNGGGLGAASNSYATGNVTATGNNVGGLLGSGTALNSYATGNVISTGNNVGGLVGLETAGALIQGYATGSVSGSSNVGGLVGYNDSYFSSKLDYAGIYGYATGNVRGTGNNVGGLVGWTDYSSIVGYATGQVTGVGQVGGLVGYGFNTSVTNSYATGRVTGAGNDVGGLAGSIGSATVWGTYATGNVSGVGDVGGLMGFNYYDHLTTAYATGGVSGTGNNVGGLVGYNQNSYVGTTDAMGSVSGSSNVGGLVGYNTGTGLIDDFAAQITISYATGRVIGSSDVGGLVGSNVGAVNGSFWNLTTSGQAASAGGTGMTTAQMQTEANFTSATGANGNVNPNWSVTSISSVATCGCAYWLMTGDTYPLLSYFMTPRWPWPTK